MSHKPVSDRSLMGMSNGIVRAENGPPKTETVYSVANELLEAREVLRRVQKTTCIKTPRCQWNECGKCMADRFFEGYPGATL